MSFKSLFYDCLSIRYLQMISVKTGFCPCLGRSWTSRHREQAHSMSVVKIIIFWSNAASPLQFTTRQGVSIFLIKLLCITSRSRLCVIAYLHILLYFSWGICEQLIFAFTVIFPHNCNPLNSFSFSMSSLKSTAHTHHHVCTATLSGYWLEQLDTNFTH